MNISASLIAKTLGALAAASAVGGGTWWIIENSDEVKTHKITRYDQALIDYLHHGGKIQFAIIKENVELTEFPKDFENKDPKTITVKIKVNGNNSNVNTEGKLTDNTKEGSGNKPKIDYLKAANKDNTGWTWSCEISFAKDNGENDPKELDASQSDMIFKSPKGGLFGKLKDESVDKKIKKEFVKKCGIARGKEKNKEINENEKNDEIKTDGGKINFELIKGENKKPWGTDTTKLFFKDKKNFNRWFSEGQTQKPNQAAST